jgi:hypothetical protein
MDYEWWFRAIGLFAFVGFMAICTYSAVMHKAHPRARIDDGPWHDLDGYRTGD